MTSADEGTGKEKVGVARIAEALSAVMWTGMRMKPRQSQNVKADEANEVDGVAAKPKPDEVSEEEKLQDAMQAFSLEGAKNEDDGLMALFGELKGVREKASKMSDEDRREYAAKMAMKMWEMIGGDDSDDES